MSHPSLRRFVAVGSLILTGAVVGDIPGAPTASAHGCSHSDHYAPHGNHLDYWDYNDHRNSNNIHWHEWYNGSHAYPSDSYCGCVSPPCPVRVPIAVRD